ncbi:hypothetical protein TSUD_399190 [Trifolium subterraneum]|uniref:RNase H type-1 domain-containing protein n=1 Tax=Trifolium subterraneum TaxID=3900 RepID=A0A2Z6NJ74_TRISU|nr:hypothetical protein TSUD_399190 [Trifolium subterraneum]
MTHKPVLLVIVETRCEPSKLCRTFKLLGYDGFLATEVNGYAGGDFNDITCAADKRGGAQVSSRRCKNFKDRINACHLLDLGSIGPKYTWRGPIYQNGPRIYEKLDRALSNDVWRMEFPDAYVKVLTRVDFSDHHPILIVPFEVPRFKVPRQFKFESAWIIEDSYFDMLHKTWNHNDIMEKNLFHLQDLIKTWKEATIDQVIYKKKEIMARLNGIQRSLHRGSNGGAFTRLEKKLQDELRVIVNKEELMWFQRSRAKWLTDGDRDTRYYHIKTISRRRKNNIVMLKDEQGQWVEDIQQLQSLVNDFYKQLFALNNRCNWSQTSITFPHLDAEVIRNLAGPVQDQEIKYAMFSMSPWKAPGPDGFPAGFYQKSWGTVGNNVCDYVRRVWNNPSEIAAVNKTDICLIPKVDHPDRVSQFRPISLCNSIYKVISKVVVERLKGHMSNLVSPFQTGFVPGRNIHENIIVAKEMVHNMNRMKGKKGFFAIKVDLSKSYDKLSWEFIWRILTEIKLPNCLLNVIMHSVTSVETNVKWNGARADYFRPQRAWTTAWLEPGLCLNDQNLAIPADWINAKVGDLVTDNGDWNWQVLRNLMPSEILHKFAASLPPNDAYDKDEFIVVGADASNFSVAAMYCILCNHDSSPMDAAWIKIWKLGDASLVECGSAGGSRWVAIVFGNGEIKRCIAMIFSGLSGLFIIFHRQFMSVVKLNTDGACKDDRTAGCGGIIRNSDGRWIGGFAKSLGKWKCNSYVAELWGVLEGLKYARRLGYQAIDLNVDSLAVKQVLTSGSSNNLLGQNLVKNIRRLLELNWKVTVEHSYRKANTCADALANIGCSLDYNIIFYDNPPTQLRHLLEADALRITTPRLILLRMPIPDAALDPGVAVYIIRKLPILTQLLIQNLLVLEDSSCPTPTTGNTAAATQQKKHKTPPTSTRPQRRHDHRVPDADDEEDNSERSDSKALPRFILFLTCTDYGVCIIQFAQLPSSSSGEERITKWCSIRCRRTHNEFGLTMRKTLVGGDGEGFGEMKMEAECFGKKRWRSKLFGGANVPQGSASPPAARRRFFRRRLFVKLQVAFA